MIELIPFLHSQIWTCPEVEFLQSIGHGVSDFSSTYPTCATANSTTSTSYFSDQNQIHLVVHASMDETTVNRGSAVREVFAMSLFVAILIHALGVEIYVRPTVLREGMTFVADEFFLVVLRMCFVVASGFPRLLT